ncbi:MAG: hypothetical protein ACREID_00820 [Planctomycetota bacterium]
MRAFFGILALCTCAVIPVALAQSDIKCDLKHVQTGLWCDACKAILDEDTTLEGKYCSKCCKDKPPAERVEAKKVKVCVKTYYRCDACNANSWQPGKCSACDAEMKKLLDKALVTLKCESCGKEADKEGPCAEPGCAAKKAMVVQVCSKSGKHPHVPEK